MYITLTFLHIQFKIMYSTLTAIEHLFQTVRSKSYRTCPYSEQINKQIMLSNNINKFINVQYTYIDIQYMNAFIKDIYIHSYKYKLSNIM